MNKIQYGIFSLLLFIFISFPVLSAEISKTTDSFVIERDNILRSLEEIEYEIEKDRLMIRYEVKNISDRYSAFSDKVVTFEKDMNSKLQLLNEKIMKIDAQLIDLNNRQKPADSSVTSTIVLTAVSVLVTVLGVMIALLAVFGYRDLKEKAIEVAERSSVEIIQDYLRENLNAEVKDGIVSVIQTKKVDKEIEEIFLKVALQGIYSSNDSDDED